MNVQILRDCYGCGVCAVVCPRQIIDIRLNGDGFYEPCITDEGRCTDCGLCVDVCSYSHADLALKDACIKSYAGWSNDAAVRRKCSSGGIGFELGRKAIEKGCKVCGVRYDVEKNRAEHYIATSIEELIPSIGSKYIQSYTVDGFRDIDLKQRYLVTGTPCQIDSFRRYVRRFKKEDNFVLMDFFCHGVPSMLMWKKYVEWAEKQVDRLTYVSWRNKFTGWHDSWAMAIDGREKGESVNWHDSYNLLIRGKKSYLNSRLSQGDIFYKLFLGDYCCNPACQKECRFKYDKSSADIRIGDAWGNTYAHDEEGVSAIIVFTEKGHRLLCESNVHLEIHPFEVVAEGQMRRNCGKAIIADAMMAILRKHPSALPDNPFTWQLIFKIEKVLRRFRRISHRIKNV